MVRLVRVEVGVDVESGVEVTSAPVGGVPDAVAVLATEPWFTSSWVITYVTVHTTVASGWTVVVAQETGPVSGSSTVTSVSVVVPVLVTAKL